jgi:hypothetical protein
MPTKVVTSPVVTALTTYLQEDGILADVEAARKIAQEFVGDPANKQLVARVERVADGFHHYCAGFRLQFKAFLETKGLDSSASYGEDEDPSPALAPNPAKGSKPPISSSSKATSRKSSGGKQKAGGRGAAKPTPTSSTLTTPSPNAR